MGREAAFELAAYVRESGDMPMVGVVLRCMYRCEERENCGVKAGFTCGIAAILSKFEGK